MNEKQFSQSVVDLAHTLGWKVYRTWSSIHSPAGYPDLFMVHEETKRAIAAELKVRDKRGRMGDLTAEQYEWLMLLQEAGINSYLWTSDDLIEEIAEILLGGKA